MNVEPPETLAIVESIVYKSNGFAISRFGDSTWECPPRGSASKISFIQVKKMSLTTNNTASYSLHNPITHQQRLECFSHYRINPNNQSHFATFPSNVRDYIGAANYSKFGNVQTAKSLRDALDVIGLDYY